MIKDLQKIRELSESDEDDNWKFRSWLKFHAPKNIDSIVRDLSRKYSSLIDCRECANCCQSLEIGLDQNEVKVMAQAKGTSTDAFSQHTFLDEQREIILKPPCPMLKGKLCGIYSDRPETCRSYPHLEKPHFLSRLIGVVQSLPICPIAFNVYEELKRKFNWHLERG
jgi:Fe-S-cluster containining protein